MTDFSGKERRRSERIDILETFSLSAVIDNKGGFRLPIHDLSENGIYCDLDMEGEDFSAFPVKEGDDLGVQVYLNQSLYVPLKVKIVRLEEDGAVRKIGAEFSKESTEGYEALVSFLRLLDSLKDVAQIAPTG